MSGCKSDTHAIIFHTIYPHLIQQENQMIPLLTALFFGFIPCFFFAAILYWLDRYEKEPKLLLIGVFLWGGYCRRRRLIHS